MQLLVHSRGTAVLLSAEDVPPEARDYFRKWGNIDLIVYEGKATDKFGHSYFSSNPDVSADLIQLIRCGRMPGDREQPLVPMGAATWKFPDLDQKDETSLYAPLERVNALAV